jgi:hypothetical protein
MHTSRPEIVERLASFRSRITPLLEFPDSGELFRTMKVLWEWLENTSEAEKNIIEDVVLSGAVDVEPFKTAQQLFEQINEERAALTLLASQEPILAESVPGQLDSYLQATYENVAVELGLVAPIPLTSITMIGCGAYPTTVLHLSESVRGVPIVGVDYSTDAVLLAHKIASKVGMQSVTFIHSSGEEYNYSASNLVIVGNVISHKQAVLSRIRETADKDVMVLVRVPWTAGLLCFEDLRDGDLAHWRLVASTDANSQLLCRTLFLQPALAAR